MMLHSCSRTVQCFKASYVTSHDDCGSRFGSGERTPRCMRNGITRGKREQKTMLKVNLILNKNLVWFMDAAARDLSRPS